MTFVDDYLVRLALPRPPRADAAALRELHAAHLLRIPFENLDIAFGTPVSLDADALADKIITRGRGGFCYELNGAFARLLTELGYRVTLLGGRVWSGSGYGPPLDHLALDVTGDDGTGWLADVGFGRHAHHPLRRTPDVVQQDANGDFRLEIDALGEITVHEGPEPKYRLEARPRELGDFDAMCWYQQHSPASHFTSTTVCSRETADGRVTMSEDTLTITDADGERRTTLADDDVILAAYREHFDLDLPAVPRLAR